MIVCNCLAGGCVGLQAGSGELQAGSRGLQSEGWDWTLALGSSLGLVLGSLAFSVPRAHQNIDNTLFFLGESRPNFSISGLSSTKIFNRLVNVINKKCLDTAMVSRSLV